MIGKLRTSFTV